MGFKIENGVLEKYTEESGVTEVVIPEGVTSIGESAFRKCRSLESITIPNGVTSIGEWAFWECSSLASITIPDGVTSIGGEAFWDCSSLESITIPNGVTSIGEGAFVGCSSLKSIVLPNSIMSIGICAFYNCRQLTGITLPEGVTSIGYGVFHSCGCLTNIAIPKSVTSIGEDAFRGCSSLLSITLPDGVTSIGESAFRGCSRLVSVTLPGSVTSIGNWAFYECKQLTSIRLPDSVTSIGAGAFARCKKLDLALPAGLTAVGEAAFRGCALTSITIPDGVTKVGRDVFLRCDKIETAGPVGGGYDYEFPWTEEIPDNAFSGLRKLKTAVLPATIQKIGTNAFGDCRELVELTMPKTANVSRTAFKDCAKLRKVKKAQAKAAAPDVKAVSSVHPQSGKEAPSPDFVMINGRLLRYNGHKKKVVIPDGTTVISKRAFYCRPITSVTIPASVRTIEQEAFYRCWNLKSITILGQIEKVEANAFDWNEPEQALPVFSSIPLRALTIAAQNKAIPAFDKWFSELDPESEVFRDDLKFIGTHLMRRFGWFGYQGFAYLVRNDALRRAVLDAKAIPAKDIEWLVAQIQPERYPEIVAALLDYKDRLLKDPKVKRSLERAKSCAEEKVFSLEMTVADWRKIFRFSYVDGGIVIREMKSWDDAVTVPARIGTKNVRTIAAGVFRFLSDGSGQEVNLPKKIAISEGIQEICTGAFMLLDDAEVFIPSTVTSLPAGTFIAVQDLIVHLPASMTEIAEDVCWDSPSPIRAIHAPAGSCAERYAKKHSIPFVAE